MRNTVELIGYYGNDEIIACSAWTSTSRKLTPKKRERIPDLIEMLWKDGHHTPFEKGSVHFLVDSEIASHIHTLKHRIGVPLNAESARYKELKEDKYYIPSDWDGIEVSIGNTNTNQFCKDIGCNADWNAVLEEYTKLGNDLYHECLTDLEPVLGRKRSKESARFFKTYNSQIQCDVSFNIRSFAHFLNLRESEHAQLEIREIAKQMRELVEGIDGNPFKHSLEMINKYKQRMVEQE